MKTYVPNVGLRPFVKAYKIIESRDERINRVIPNTSFMLAFRFRGQISYVTETGKIALPTATFSGLRKSARLINYEAQTSALIVQFEETGVSAFFRHPLHELFEESIPLYNFFPQSEISIVEEQLDGAANHLTRIAIIEAFLCSKLMDSKPDKLVAEAIAKIHAHHGIIRIKELVQSLPISHDAFEKRFRKVVGATPKQFSSIIKIKTLIDQKPAPSTFTNRALEYGYYDQAHFNKDFKLFTGLSPTEFFKSGFYW